MGYEVKLYVCFKPQENSKYYEIIAFIEMQKMEWESNLMQYISERIIEVKGNKIGNGRAALYIESEDYKDTADKYGDPLPELDLDRVIELTKLDVEEKHFPSRKFKILLALLEKIREAYEKISKGIVVVTYGH